MLSEILTHYPKILAECAIAERLRRHPGVELHPQLFHSPVIYGPENARAVLTSLYREYIEVAAEAGLPLLLTAPTWRLDPERIAAAGVPTGINTGAVEFLITLAEEYAGASPVLVGALVGPRGDCYRPEEAMEPADAEAFHRAQINELAQTPAAFLLAQTMPAVSEAIGIARAMAATDKPYFISFCPGSDGRVLDGTSLPTAMKQIDQSVGRPPLGYFVNCTHPAFLTENYPPDSLDRLVGIQANGSSKEVAALEESCATEADPLDAWTQAMSALHQSQSVPILGGCCGTGKPHLQQLSAL